jgi:class 3 adenylate cyclase
MSALPSGTVTLAFTDIEGSTFLLRRLGDRYGELLAAHRRIVRGTFCTAGGVEVDRQGDAFFFAFPRARDAVHAAVDAQREHAQAEWPDDAAVRVRIGLHTGEPLLGAEGYLGMDVVKGARICDLARGGQILLSETTYALVSSTLPPGVAVLPAGERQLKDVDEPERVYVLATDGPLRHVSRLPLPASWEREIEERFGTVGTGLVSRIGERIAGSLESENLEHLVGRAVAVARAGRPWHPRECSPPRSVADHDLVPDRELRRPPNGLRDDRGLDAGRHGDAGVLPPARDVRRAAGGGPPRRRGPRV